MTGIVFEIRRTSTLEELHAVQRLRYRVYVDEMGRYRDRADHANRRLADPEDDHSWVFSALDGDDVVASTRITWGGDGFSERQIEQYSLAPFLEEVPASLMAVGERTMVLSAYRGTSLLDELLACSAEHIDAHDVRVVFGACEPHLLPVYMSMGQRPYAERNINSDEAGYLIPLVAFMPDPEVLRGIGHDPTALPRCVERALSGVGSVTSRTLSAPDEYWDEIRRALDQVHTERISAFDGFSDDEAERCLTRSNVIECSQGDRVLKKGGTARNIFVVLEGTLEVRDQDVVIAVLSPGDIFGEMAFLLEQPRSFDVFAAAGHVRVLSLSEGALRKMIAEDPAVAAKLLINVSRMLCLKLLQRH